VSVVPATEALTPEFVNVTSTDDAAAGVPAPSTTTTVDALAYVHVAEVPLLGVAPTFAVHTNPSMKLVPVTVTVLLAYADKGAIEAAVGLSVTLKFAWLPNVELSALAYGSKDILMSQPLGVAAVPARTTTVAVVELTQVHADTDAVAMLAEGATYALQAVLASGKPVPANVIVLPAYAEAGSTPVRETAPLAVCNESASAAKNKRLGCARNLPDFELLLKTRCEADGIFKGARARAQISFGLARCNFCTMRLVR